MQLVALPEDERSLPRTQADYGESYSPSYVESEKEYLSALAKSLSDYSKPGADPLAMPIDIGTGAITKANLAKAIALPRQDALDYMQQAIGYSSDYINSYIKRLHSAANSMLKRVPSAITDYVDEFRYAPITNKSVDLINNGVSSAAWVPSSTRNNIIEVDPSALFKLPNAAASPLHVTGHELGHAGIDLLRDITTKLSIEDKLPVVISDRYKYQSADKIEKLNKIAEENKLTKTTIDPEDIQTLKGKNLLADYWDNYDKYGYEHHPEEFLAEAYGVTAANLSDKEKLKSITLGYKSPDIFDYINANVLNKLLKKRQ